MTRRRQCCCLINCTVSSDDFDRANSSNLGVLWTKQTGSSEIEDQTVKISPAGLITTTVNGREAEMHVSATPVNVQIGDKHRIIVNYEEGDAEGSYLYVDFETIDEFATRVRLCAHDEGEGEDWILKLEDIARPEEGATINVCLTQTSFSVQASPGSTGWVYACNPPMDISLVGSVGLNAGLGNGGDSEVFFDDFSHQNYHGQTPDGVCCTQQCHAADPETEERTCIPNNLLITLTAEGGCSPLDGERIEINYDNGTNTWHNTHGTTPKCMQGPMQWTVTCEGAMCPGEEEPGPLQQFLLSTWRDNGDCGSPSDECMQIGQSEDSLSTDPLVVVFPKVYQYAQDPAPGVCGCCDEEQNGWWYATVTEIA